MPNSGYTATLPTDILLDTGVLMVGAAVVGVSRGGLRFVPGHAIQEIDYDGRKAPVRGLDRIAFRRARITGTMLEASNTILRRYEPGGATPGVTMKGQGVMLVTGDYVANLILVYRRGQAGTATITFPYALCVRYEIGGQKDGEAEIPVEFEARQVQGATPDDSAVPYTIAVT
jgi:urease beta subunit